MTSTALSIVLWPFRQFRAYLGNLWALFTETRPDDVVPPWIKSTLSWLKSQLPKAAGYGTPQEQIIASVVIAVAMIVGSVGLLTILSAVMLVPLWIGFMRLYPAVNKRWPLN